MSQEIIHTRIKSISSDVQHLSNVLVTLDGTDTKHHFSDYEKVSLEAAQRAE